MAEEDASTSLSQALMRCFSVEGEKFEGRDTEVDKKEREMGNQGSRRRVKILFEMEDIGVLLLKTTPF